MIPATYPSILDSSNRTKMLVYQVPTITGLTRWIDYIPVKSPTSESDLTLANTFANEGFILTSKVNDITGLVPFKDYVPIYLDSTATKAWSADNDGYIPMAELAGLLLDFTTGSLDIRINFSRTTNATVTNSAGQIAYAPHNLLTYSEQFDNAAWFKTRSSISANVIVAPNGTTSADKLIEDTTVGNTHIVTQNYTTSALAYTYSVYAKAGERTWIRIDNASVTNATAFFDLATGVVGTVGATATATILSVGNGWYRCSITATATAASNTFRIALSFDGIFVNYTGDGTSGAYIWGAQLEVGTSPTTYNSTTVKNLLGYSELFDNAAWTKSNSFVQTNLLKYSEDFSVSASWNAASGITANTTIAPNGYQTADTIDVALAIPFQQVTCTASTVYTYSVYIQLGTLSAANFKFAVRDDTAGVFIAQDIVPTQTPTSAGWTRITYTFTTPVGCVAVRPYLYRNTASPTGTFFAWGAQLVQGSDAGDYRRTDSTSLPVYYANHNGVVCAEKLVESVGSAQHSLSENISLTINTTLTQSYYVKAAGRTKFQIRRGLAGAFPTPPTALVFDLTAGTYSGSLSSGWVNPTITSVGNGWYRISITVTTTATGSDALGIYLCDDSGNSTYIGDGTSGIYIFGAQLSDSASLDPYVLNAAAAPTAAAYYGARFDYDPVTLAPKGLLIEEQRANLLLNSTVSGTNLATQNVTVTAVAHTLSFYGTGNIVLSGTASATLTGTGAYPTRSTLTFTPTAGTLTLTVSGTVQYAQLEIGSFATSFIPTAASQVTRAADVATIQGSNFYSWLNANEGSMVTNFDWLGASSFDTMFAIGTDANNYTFLGLNSSNVQRMVNTYVGTTDMNTIVAPTGGITANTYYKLAGSYKINDYAVVSNNGTVFPDTSAIPPIYNQARLGQNVDGTNGVNGHIKSISYFPQKLSDNVLKGLTA